MAVALEWTARTTAISVEMVAPALVGHWLDLQWDISPLCLLLGAILGFIIAMMNLVQMAKTAGKDKKPK
jgi:F0F1-type ATP synthase assembly protein I